MELKYIESDIGKIKLKKYKKLNLIYLIIFMLLTLFYLILFLDTHNINGIIVFSVIYIIFSLFIKLIKEKYLAKVTADTLAQEICLDAYINIQIYNAKKIEKLSKIFKFNKAYNFTLLNLIDGYYRKGNFEEVNNLIIFLEKRQLGNNEKAFIIRYRAAMAFAMNDEKEFNIQYENFDKVSNLVTDKYKQQILFSLNIQQQILKNNIEEVNKMCENLINNKLLLNKVMGYYYKGLIFEKNNNEEYKKYYKFVVENGNDLYIAKTAGKKIGVVPKIKYNLKKHTGLKILTFLILAILSLITIFEIMFYVENAKIKKWDTGIIYINKTKVVLPCPISKFEEIMDLNIDINAIEKLGFYKLYLNNIDNNKPSDKYIELYIENNNIIGVNINIFDGWNNSIKDAVDVNLDEELGKMIIFPGNITANSKIDQVKKIYKTGIINPSFRDWQENITISDKETLYTYGFKYSGKNFDISIDTIDGKIESIFYYYK